MAGNGYLFEDSPAERERLARQAVRLRPLTQRFLAEAGIAPGMTVLELGCGTGEVTALLCAMVGPRGRVMALEQSPVMVAQAQEHLASRGWDNAEFMQLSLDEPFELPATLRVRAVVGRLILAHLADPVAALRTATRHLEPAGVVAFQEPDFTLSDHLRALAGERLALVNQVCAWIDLAARQTRMHRYMGRELHQVFAGAGLPEPKVEWATEVYAGDSPQRVRDTVTILRNLMPRLAALGVDAATIGIGTLEQRLAAELCAAQAVQARASIASAWVRTPERA